ncbi:MAG: hypothetical protein COA79_22495 [Planctomycetota bacterium]|nr:MAG: hypothetical protein COA79_22495 [Planctomycetota bacterium]
MAIVNDLLLIDDSNALRRVLAKYISNKFQCNVLEATDGKEGLEKVFNSENDIQLILCDLMMPIMDGFTFIRQIKLEEKYNLIPIICLTAKSDKKTVTTCIKLGAIDFIVKPYDLASVAEKINKFISKK